MRKSLPILLLCLLAACTEKVELQSVSDYHDYLVVDALLTDRATDAQTVTLSHTVSYFQDEAVPGVGGAEVSIDGTPFTETENGIYVGPEGFHGTVGRSHHLEIRLRDGTFYEADATMPQPGFELDAVDYAYAGNKALGLDSLWTLAIWGRDRETASYYCVRDGVNGHFIPFQMNEIMDDKYFNGNEIQGFPITTLYQGAWLYDRYGECYKYLETGDVITLEAYTLDKSYYDFLFSITMSSFSIPIFSPQPANAPTNIRGEHVLGWFAACPVTSAEVTVDDPFRPIYKRMLPSF
ncbi:MAG: DUF4249 domain-containing protein [Bacteroidales bacterium]|nr:DUF4249 domain-containing protein [Bacteroidales bacterium]